MRPPGRSEHRHPGAGRGWRHGPPQGWRFIRGIHRRLLSLIFFAVGLGGLGGWLVHGASGHTLLFLAFVGLGAAWLLAWVATRRIARPVRDLARMATELREGRLHLRGALHAAHGDAGSEFGELSRGLHGMAERVERQIKDQQALMAAVSHELRSPLGRARVLVELARDGARTPDPFDALQAEIDSMDGLVGDLLAAARIDFAAVAPVRLEPVALARRALDQAHESAEKLVVEGDPALLHADATLLSRALAVMVANARGHGGGLLRLRVVQTRDERLRFEVEDAGPGFAPGEEEQAFEPFWRGRGPRPPGEGLGLALVRRIADVHDGAAGAGNRAEGGARCWLELPVATHEPEGRAPPG